MQFTNNSKGIKLRFLIATVAVIKQDESFLPAQTGKHKFYILDKPLVLRLIVTIRYLLSFKLKSLRVKAVIFSEETVCFG